MIRLKEGELIERQSSLQALSYFYVDALAVFRALEGEVASSLQIFGALEGQARAFSSLTGSQGISAYSQLMGSRLQRVSGMYTKSAEALEALLAELQRSRYLCDNAHRDVLEALVTVDSFLQNKEETITRIFEGFVS